MTFESGSHSPRSKAHRRASRSLPAIPRPLEPLIDYLDRLKQRATLPELTDRLRGSSLSLGEFHRFIRFDPLRYTRTLIAEGPNYSLLLLCWRSGQRSTIHDHAASACAFKVLAGVCSETTYRLAPCGQIVPQRTDDFPAGEVVAAEQPKVHQVSNLQPVGHDMVTLHLYTPPLTGLKTFSIMGGDLATDWAGNGRGWLPDETKYSPQPAGLCLEEELFEKVVRYMRANLRHDIHLADFAKLTGYTEAHFSLLFRNRTDCSPFHYLKELRLREAHRLIVAGERDVERIALAAGYTHRGHFAEVFVAYWGYTVQQLMRQVRRTVIDHRP